MYVYIYIIYMYVYIYIICICIHIYIHIGMVVKAEYRGTNVAVKRVIPPRAGKARESIFDKENKASFFGTGLSSVSAASGEEEEEGGDEVMTVEEKMQARFQDAKAGMASDDFMTSHGGTFSVSSRSQKKEPWWKTLLYGDENSRLRADFVEEMRTLSKLRHPCITTVMGAVVDKRTEPMMVMELMDYGSLYDLLHNDSIEIEGDLILPILRDIAQVR